MSDQELFSRSTYLAPARPAVSRERSYSLPVGLASMNAEEAGLLFSAAEKATSRRRRVVSVDTPSWTDHLDTSSEPTPTASIKTAKASPSAQFTNFSGVHMGGLATADARFVEHRKTLQALELNSQTSPTKSIMSPPPELILQSLPVSPRRQVASRPLKDYADGLFLFTRSRISTAMPQLSPTFPALVPDLQLNEEPLTTHLDRFPRPGLQSHFSDWSTVTGTQQNSRPTSLAVAEDPDVPMMSPDSFFGGAISTPRLGNSGASSSRTFASSPTYDPPTELPAPTPSSQGKHAILKDEDVSYFSNFDLFLKETDGSQSEPMQHITVEQPPDTMMIDLSPLEHVSSAPNATRSRPRTDTVIRSPAIPWTKSGNNSGSGSGGRSTPSTPFERAIQTAEVAVRIPHWLVGTIR